MVVKKDEGGVNVSYNNKLCACMHTIGDYTLMSLFFYLGR